jgi:hypothetical protein
MMEMNPKNFPERKRQRQLGALERIAPMTRAGISNFAQKQVLSERVSIDARSIRTKKDRSSQGRFRNA